MYYVAYAGPVRADRFNACTNAQLAPLIAAPFSLTDDVSVLPNWDFLTEGDGNVGLFDQNAQPIRFWTGNGIDLSDMRTLSLDPDGTSFWAGGFVSDQVDLGSSRSWNIGARRRRARPRPSRPSPSMAQRCWATPMSGSSSTPTRPGRRRPSSSARASGTDVKASSVRRFQVHSTEGRRRCLLRQEGPPRCAAGAVDAHEHHVRELELHRRPPVPVSAGQRYWIAVLAPRGAGTIRFRDTSSGPGSTTSAQRRLAALPAQWSTGTVFSDGNLSAYGS